MCNPMMAITTGKVYEHLAIQKWIESGQNVDPTNGIPLCIEQSKDAAFELNIQIIFIFISKKSLCLNTDFVMI